MSDQPQFDFGPDDELEEEREQSGEEWAEDASDVLGNNPLGKAAGTGTKCTVCHSEFWIKKKDHTQKFCTGYCEKGVDCQMFRRDRKWWDKYHPESKQVRLAEKQKKKREREEEDVRKQKVKQQKREAKEKKRRQAQQKKKRGSKAEENRIEAIQVRMVHLFPSSFSFSYVC